MPINNAYLSPQAKFLLYQLNNFPAGCCSELLIIASFLIRCNPLIPTPLGVSTVCYELTIFKFNEGYRKLCFKSTRYNILDRKCKNAMWQYLLKYAWAKLSTSY